MNKDLLRKAYGLAPPTGPEDVRVTQRKALHIKAASALAKWSLVMQCFFALVGVFLVLFPTIWPQWRAVVLSWPIIDGVYIACSTLTGWPLWLCGLLVSEVIALNWLVKDFPGGWNSARQHGFPSLKQIVDLDLYPRTKQQERGFFVYLLFVVSATPLYLLAFSVLAFMISAV